MSRGSQLLGLTFIALSVVNVVIGADLIPGLILLLVGVSLLTGVYCVPIVWYQARKRPELFREESEFTADSVGVRYVSPFGNSSSPWSAFKRVRARGGFLFLDTGVGANVYVPLQAFDADARARLDGLLRDAGVVVGQLW